MTDTAPAASGENILVIVPARSGSKRLPGKNRLSIAGRSLIERISDVVDDALPRAPVLVSSDDDALMDAARGQGWHVLFRRPDALCSDTASTASVVGHALDAWAQHAGADPAFFLLAQTTSPFRSPELLRAAVATAATDPAVDCVISVTELKVGAAHVMTLSADSALASVAPGSDQKVYVPNGALYLCRTTSFRAIGAITHGRIRGVKIDFPETIDIDTPLDLNVANAFAARASASAPPLELKATL